jgi:hypothetical protein
VKIRQVIYIEVGRWFDDNLRRVVGNGVNTSFRLDTWVGGVPLSGGGCCLHERKIWLRSVVFCFIILFSRLMK